MQHSLVFGLAGHNYLALRNENGDVVEELHGLATDERTQRWTYVGYKTTDILQVWRFHGPLYQINNKQYPGIILKEGGKEEVNKTWDKATPCIEAINVKKIPYPSLGISIKQTTKNSNSVAYTLSYCMELDAKHLGLITPGSGENLLK